MASMMDAACTTRFLRLLFDVDDSSSQSSSDIGMGRMLDGVTDLPGVCHAQGVWWVRDADGGDRLAVAWFTGHQTKTKKTFTFTI